MSGLLTMLGELFGPPRRRRFDLEVSHAIDREQAARIRREIEVRELREGLEELRAEARLARQNSS